VPGLILPYHQCSLWCQTPIFYQHVDKEPPETISLL
jgi:hypothetical protein